MRDYNSNRDQRVNTQGMRRGTIFLAVCAVIAGSVAAINSVWQAALLVIIAIATAIAGLEIRKYSRLRAIAPVSWIVAAMMFWFASVDRYATIEFCQQCPIHHFQYDYRFLGLSIYVRVIDEHDALVSLCASDLGRPCHHKYQSFALARRWGLFYYSGYSSCMCCLVSDENYNKALRQRIADQGRTQPNLKNEFYDRVVVGRDWKFLHSFAIPATSISTEQDDAEGNL